MRLITLIALSVSIFSQASNQEFVPGEILVQWKKGDFVANSLQMSLLQQKLGSMKIQSLEPNIFKSTLVKIKLEAAADVREAVRKIETLENVEIAEPNFIYRAVAEPAVPNDTEFGKLWAMNNTGQADSAGQVGKAGSDIKALTVWNKGYVGSENVLVGVIDTGTLWDHPDLANNIYTNPGEAGSLSNNGVDDDGNGFVDDVHGWNFYAQNNSSTDDNDHGTHCAGIIGAEGNNQEGVAGVNWKVKILPIKFLSGSGSGSLQGAVDAIRYGIKAKVQVLSNSWGGTGYSRILEQAVEETKNAGIVFVAAAGNNRANNDTARFYPANFDFPNLISVAATDNQDKLASFSNYGATKVHVAAPGVKILSTTKDKGYKSFSGTSMACPHVSGAVAMLLGLEPSLTPAEIRARLIQTSDPIDALGGKSVSNGRINLEKLLYGSDSR